MSMKFQNCNLIFVTDTQTDERADGRMGGQAQSNMPLTFSEVGDITIRRYALLSGGLKFILTLKKVIDYDQKYHNHTLQTTCF